MALLYGCAGRLTAQNGGFRPGQIALYVVGGVAYNYKVGLGRIVVSETEARNMLAILV
jgi:ABC-type anion transport system duplicated permease subunit